MHAALASAGLDFEVVFAGLVSEVNAVLLSQTEVQTRFTSVDVLVPASAPTTTSRFMSYSVFNGW